MNRLLSVLLLPGLLTLVSAATVNGGASPPADQSPATPAASPATSPGTALALPSVPQGNALAPMGNMVLNGDFESTTSVGCDYNNSNASYTSKMTSSTAFGGAEEIDIMDGVCYGPAAQSGVKRLGIHTQVGGLNDAFSLDLAYSTTAGSTYRLTFYALAETSFDPDLGVVEVGLSTSATSFGTLVASGALALGTWTFFDTTFVAPISGSYLTVRTSTSFQSWNHVDNFILCDTAASATFRNAGPNWPSYAAGLPILGTTWTSTIMPSMSGHAGAWLVGYAAPITIPLGGWMLLVDPSSSPELLGLPPLFGATVTYGVPLPADLNFCGIGASTQGVHFGGGLPWALTNANDLVLGGF